MYRVIYSARTCVGGAGENKVLIRVGVYKCIATNSEGDDSKEFKIELNSEPAFEESPTEIIIAPNDQSEMQLR